MNGNKHCLWCLPVAADTWVGQETDSGSVTDNKNWFGLSITYIRENSAAIDAGQRTSSVPVNVEFEGESVTRLFADQFPHTEVHQNSTLALIV